MLDATAGVTHVSSRELDRRLRGGEPVVVLDVRRREAWTADPARVPGGTWVPLEEVPKRAREIPRETPLVVYCD
jgi:rhodanese-related sulfurtransferase